MGWTLDHTRGTMRGAPRMRGQGGAFDPTIDPFGSAPMEPPVPRPDTIDALRWGADAAFAMLAGLQLDLFTALQSGAQTPPQLAATLGVGADRLRLLLYALVAAGLLTEQDGRFANTPEAQHFLVQGTPRPWGLCTTTSRPNGPSSSTPPRRSRRASPRRISILPRRPPRP